MDHIGATEYFHEFCFCLTSQEMAKSIRDKAKPTGLYVLNITLSSGGLERVKQIIVLMVVMAVELRVGTYPAHISNLLQMCSQT